jgi:hypothetical protein
MTTSRRTFLYGVTGSLVVRPLQARQVPRHIVISCDSVETVGDYERGVRLGAQEAERLATLLGHRFDLRHDGTGIAVVARQSRRSAIPLVAMTGVSEAPCVFVTASMETERAEARARLAKEVVDWHPGFRRYGASELNERFEKAFGVPMTADAWHGWVAIKAVTEAAIRGDDLCTELARLRFDGHKGRALTFDRETRRLRHPLLAVSRDRNGAVVEALP